MIWLVLSLWTLAIILIVTDFKIETTRWASMVAFFSGVGGFSAVWEEDIIPLIKQNYVISQATEQDLYTLVAVFSAISHYLAPFVMLWYGLVFANILPKRWKKLIFVLLLVPSIFSFFYYPYVSNTFKTPLERLEYFRSLSVWTIPYIFVSSFLIVYSTIKERNPALKRIKVINCLIVAPFVTIAGITNFILRDFGIDNTWRYNTVFIVIQFVIFMVFAAKYGVLGVKLKFEKLRIDSAMKAMTSGTSIINHTIKNEILKISMCAENVKSGDNISRQEIVEDMQVILDSTKHMLTMVNRIQEQTKDILLEETQCSISELIDHALQMSRPVCENKGIEIIRNYDSNIDIVCDRVHIIEVLNNIIKNSVEAIRTNGRINIYTQRNKKNVFLIIEDNGAGISKEDFQYVFDPFFSTKKLTLNFGLGLSYCYNVMQKHGGTLELKSEENVGTSVILKFNPRKVVNMTPYISRKGVVSG